MPDIREEFEAWVSGRKVCTRYGAKLNTNPDGMYSDYRINDRWLAWKASRAALRVELPPELHAGDLFEDTPIYNASMIKVILQQAGIEVK
ncbi:TPA: hypothetical protein NIC12_004820 [Pseudomonas aeruginosa]|nr:hypothetical protein [Pseudomonas aeruginosa]HCF3506327.1 hypothetical protein [Pseudomonas aeruginosa]